MNNALTPVWNAQCAMHHNLRLRQDACYVYVKKSVLMNNQLHYSILVNLIL
jgi:hypothetical protein